jgi:hypothetical protein
VFVLRQQSGIRRREAMQFRNPGHALRWAFQVINEPIVKVSSINKMRGPSGHGEMTPHDRHAQAALIIGLCERVLSPLHFAYVKVQFGKDCTGMDILARHIAGCFGTGLHSRRGIEQIIRGYCGDRVTLSDLKISMRVGHIQAAALRNKGYYVLDSIHAQFMTSLWREMEERELLVATA